MKRIKIFYYGVLLLTTPLFLFSSEIVEIKMDKIVKVNNDTHTSNYFFYIKNIESMEKNRNGKPAYKIELNNKKTIYIYSENNYKKISTIYNKYKTITNKSISNDVINYVSSDNEKSFSSKDNNGKLSLEDYIKNNVK